MFRSHVDQLVLASASPRRLELLQQIGVNCLVLPVNIPEVPEPNETPEHYVERLALEKARAGHSAMVNKGMVNKGIINTAMLNKDVLYKNERQVLPVLGADTVVVLDHQAADTCNDSKSAAEILEKPRDKDDANRMLGLLSGRVHTVMSAVAMVDGEQERYLINQTRVHFRRIDDFEKTAYWETGEPADKAGGYGIQGLGSVFVEKIEGSYSGVMGLPIVETCQLLTQFKVSYWNATNRYKS
ncbi:MAG: Maf-like protein [Pseudomonadales bacterium]|nr:Maf-like protein [Pseudomonadales bacterium]